MAIRRCLWVLLIALAGCSREDTELDHIYGEADGTPLVHDDIVLDWQYAGISFVIYTWDAWTGEIGGYGDGNGVNESAPALGADGVAIFATDVLTAYTDGLEEWWQVPIPGNHVYTPVTIGQDGDIYVGTDYGTLHRYSRDGDMRWATVLSDSVSVGPYQLIGRIAVDREGASYLFASDPRAESDRWRLFGVSPDGEVLWEANAATPTVQPALSPDGQICATVWTGEEDDVTDPSWGVVRSPLAELRCWDTEGTQLFSVSVGGPTSTAVFDKRGDVLVALLNEDVVVAFDPDDGREVWRSDELPDVSELTIGDDDRIYTGCGFGVCALSSRGNLQTEFEAFGPVTLPVSLHHGHVIASVEGTVSAWELGADVNTAPGLWARAGANDRGTGSLP